MFRLFLYLLPDSAFIFGTFLFVQFLCKKRIKGLKEQSQLVFGYSDVIHGGNRD